MLIAGTPRAVDAAYSSTSKELPLNTKIRSFHDLPYVHFPPPNIIYVSIA